MQCWTIPVFGGSFFADSDVRLPKSAREPKLLRDVALGVMDPVRCEDVDTVTAWTPSSLSESLPTRARQSLREHGVRGGLLD